MFALRCTQKLQRRIGHPLSAVVGAADTQLGDWYANLLVTKPAHLILCVSERTLLPIVVEARNPSMLRARMVEAVRQVLGSLGVPAASVERECAAMDRLYFAKTESKSILGVLNEFIFQLKYSLAHRPELSLLEQSLWLAQTPVAHTFPDRATQELFAIHGASYALQ
ncbi:MAG: hypothetical protein F9K36_11635 [Burkholderiaceae bacterium]|nr:MAG: hypothetical protein F9K36_11635 [Burkholderiaceae bacterium]